MAKQKIKAVPYGNKLMLDIPETTAGGIAVVQGQQIQEQGTIIAKGPLVPDSLKVGLTIQFKAWAVDIVTIDGEKFYYLDANSDAICAIVVDGLK